MSWKVGDTTTSFDVVNSIFSSALRSMPPSAMIAVIVEFVSEMLTESARSKCLSKSRLMLSQEMLERPLDFGYFLAFCRC